MLKIFNVNRTNDYWLLLILTGKYILPIHERIRLLLNEYLCLIKWHEEILLLSVILQAGNVLLIEYIITSPEMFAGYCA